MTTVIQPGVTLPVPHLAVPFTLAADGSAAVVAQDSVEEIAQCVGVLLATVTGSRTTVPDYGIADPTFAGLDPAEVVAAVATWEPRAAVTVDVASPPDEQLQVTVTVRPEAS